MRCASHAICMHCCTCHQTMLMWCDLAATENSRRRTRTLPRYSSRCCRTYSSPRTAPPPAPRRPSRSSPACWTSGAAAASSTSPPQPPFAHACSTLYASTTSHTDLSHAPVDGRVPAAMLPPSLAPPVLPDASPLFTQLPHHPCCSLHMESTPPARPARSLSCVFKERGYVNAHACCCHSLPRTSRVPPLLRQEATAPCHQPGQCSVIYNGV